MDVILQEPIQGVGKIGDVVSVKTGYARNFLLPQNKALRATAENIAKLEEKKAALEKEQGTLIKAAEAHSEKLAEATVSIARPASETGQLYGSVKARDIADALGESKVDVERSMIQIGTPIREVGEHTIKVALHPEVIVELQVSVERATNN